MKRKCSLLRLRLTKAMIGCCLVFLGLGITLDRSTYAAPPSSFSLTMHNQHFSANLIRAPLEQVLHTISSYGPIQFVLKGNLGNDQVSSSFRHLSLEESLEKLLVRYDFAIIHHQIDSAQKTSEFPYSTEVVILSRNHSETISGSHKNLIISPGRDFSQPQRIFPSANFENVDSLRAFDLAAKTNPQESLEEVEEAIQDTDFESLALIKKLLEE